MVIDDSWLTVADIDHLMGNQPLKKTNSSGSSNFCFVFHYSIGMVPNKSKHYKNWLSIWESNQRLQDHTPDQTISTGDTNALQKNNKCKSSNSQFNPSWVWKIKKHRQLWETTLILSSLTHPSYPSHWRETGRQAIFKNQGKFRMQPWKWMAISKSRQQDSWL